MAALVSSVLAQLLTPLDYFEANPRHLILFICILECASKRYCGLFVTSSQYVNKCAQFINEAKLYITLYLCIGSWSLFPVKVLQDAEMPNYYKNIAVCLIEV